MPGPYRQRKGRLFSPFVSDHSDNADISFEHGYTRGRLGKWEEAALDLSKWVELEPDHPLRYLCLAPVLLKKGDLEAYDKLRLEILRRFSATSNPVTAERMAKACLILPASDKQMEQIARMTDRMVEEGTNHWGWTYFQFTKGWTELRQGKFSPAANRMRIVLDEKKGEVAFRDAEAFFVLALACHGLRDEKGARQALADGAEVLRRILPESDQGDFGPDWKDSIIGEFLMREAKQAIEGPN